MSPGTTRWTLVLRAANPSAPDAAAALGSLCETYWYPVYAFIRRRGHSTDDARDLTQAFFTRMLQREFLAMANPQRGRFRAFLLTSVQHFLSNEYDHEHALKRGGGYRFVPLDFDSSETRYCAEPPDGLTPEALYERRWALTLLNTALRDLQAEADHEGWREQFAALQPLLLGSDRPLREVAAEIGMSDEALRVALHRFRRRFANVVRRHIADTVSSPAEIDGEIRYLMKAVSRGNHC